MKTPQIADVVEELKGVNARLGTIETLLGGNTNNGHAIAAEAGRVINKARQNPSPRQPITAQLAKAGTPPKARADRSSVKPGAKGGM